MSKLIIFDLDGVIFDSRKNMELAWEGVRNKFKIKTSFKSYFKKIGLPFENILDQLKIKKEKEKIKKIYRKYSIKNLNLIKIYPNVIKVLELLKKKKYKIAVITSKEKSRAIALIKKFNLKFDYVQCPEKKLNGKPYPDLLNKLQSKFNLNKKNIFYIGDTLVDYKFAKNSKINFIYCRYGYGKLNLKKVKSVNNIYSVLKYVF